MKNIIWRFIDTDITDGYYSAALFESIAKYVGSGEVDDTILFWRFSITAVYLGYHQYVEDEIHRDYYAANGIQVVRGGCSVGVSGSVRRNRSCSLLLPARATARFPQTSRGHIHASLSG